MILNNTQANIFKVNGGIADNFANRPAASGSFYIFYSIDTQEIYYDNGAWILIGSGGGGGGVNIYNSDGTLTGNRTLSGANNDLNFADLNIFKTSVGGNDIGLKLDFANDIFRFGYNNESSINVYKDIVNNKSIIFTQNYFGDSEGIEFSSGSLNYLYLGFTSTSSLTYISIDADNEIIKTSNLGNDIGLKLDFANTTYQFGQITGGNNTFLRIDDATQNFQLYNSGISRGLDFAINLSVFKYGEPNRGNRVFLQIEDSNFLKIATFFQNVENGLRLDQSGISNIYQFGQINGANTTHLTIDDAAAYPVQLNGTNITSNTAGGASSQHLKIKLNGIDYKIELRNP